MSYDLLRPLNWLRAKFSQKIRSADGLSKPIRSQGLPAKNNSSEDVACCNNIVHIAYRGVSDDHLNIAYDRKWQEVKFFRPRGLRVFCKTCRRRIY